MAVLLSRLGVSFLLSLGLLVTHAGCSTERPPNIVFVLADDVGWADVSWNNKNMR